MNPEFDAIVVGAGLGGLTCAHQLATRGLNVVVVERGKFAGAKNMWGGAFYGSMMGDFIPHFWKEAPIERYLVQHTLSFLSKDRCFSTSFAAEPKTDPPCHAFTILRSQFDQWFARKATEAGAIVACGVEATDLLRNGDQFVGIKAGAESFLAKAVVLCEGVNAVLAQKAGLQGELKAREMKLGVKEIIGLPKETLEQRFHLGDREGISWQFVGSPTQGLPGGGFLYTNQKSLSVGIVVQLSELAKHGLNANELLENFKNSWPVRDLIKDGELQEYSAHLIPLSGIHGMPKLYAPGLLVAGDAAGLVLGTGLILEGGNFAVASGLAAAKTVQRCSEEKNFSADAFSRYQKILENNFVLKDLETFKRAPKFLENPRIYNQYPDLLCTVGERVACSDGRPRQHLSRLVYDQVREKVSLSRAVQDAVEAMRAI